jgi:hypothetical protein
LIPHVIEHAVFVQQRPMTASLEYVAAAQYDNLRFVDRTDRTNTRTDVTPHHSAPQSTIDARSSQTFDLCHHARSRHSHNAHQSTYRARHSPARSEFPTLSSCRAMTSLHRATKSSAVDASDVSERTHVTRTHSFDQRASDAHTLNLASAQSDIRSDCTFA